MRIQLCSEHGRPNGHPMLEVTHTAQIESIAVNFAATNEGQQMANNSLGICTWIYGGLDLPSICRTIAPLGYAGVELHADLASAPAEANRVLADHGLSVLSLTPPDVDISHPDAAIRGAAVDALRRMLDWAAELRAPRAAIHGLVGRIRAISSQQEEDDLLVESSAILASHAKRMNIALVFEVLNRYESHQINTAQQGLKLIDDVGGELTLLLDAYHMNIEEADPATALRTAGDRLGLYHAADSNRLAPGGGHTDFARQAAALAEIGYAGPIVVEIAAAGPDPFTPNKGPDFRTRVTHELATAAAAIRAW
jgi:D-psicose/D-tagatose/L-ribulose 3-epimerase